MTVSYVVDIVIAGKDAVTSIDDARHEVAVSIGIGHALPVDDMLGRRREVGPHRVKCIFHGTNLIEGHRCARIALHTATALALVKVAAEAFRKDIG